MLNCREVTRLYSEAQERELTLRERMGLQMHVLMCEGCRNFGQQMRTLRSVARAYAQRGDESAGDDDKED